MRPVPPDQIGGDSYATPRPLLLLQLAAVHKSQAALGRQVGPSPILRLRLGPNTWQTAVLRQVGGARLRHRLRASPTDNMRPETPVPLLLTARLLLKVRHVRRLRLAGADMLLP